MEFFTCSKVSLLNNQTPNTKICAMCPNRLAQTYQRALAKHLTTTTKISKSQCIDYCHSASEASKYKKSYTWKAALHLKNSSSLCRKSKKQPNLMPPSAAIACCWLILLKANAARASPANSLQVTSFISLDKRRVALCLFVSAVHFTPYSTNLSSMVLIWAAGARC